MSHAALRFRIRCWLAFFIFALVASGLTAFPLVWETGLLDRIGGPESAVGGWFPGLAGWIHGVAEALADTDARYPFLAYGTDWLAFAHLVIAVAFIGPWRDPVRNAWVIDFGLIACAMVIPLALICGPLRGIPLVWRLLDCSFVVLGAIPLLIVRRLVRQLAAQGG